MPESFPPWVPDGVAFCWQPKTALHHIRESLEAVNGVSSGIAVYVALTEVASDRRSGVFQATHAHLAARSGLSVRTVQHRIKNLSDLGLIRYTVPSLKSPATYELLPQSDKQPLPNVEKQAPNDANQLRSDKQPLLNVRQPPETSGIADNLIINKEVSKNEIKRGAPTPEAETPSWQEWWAYCQSMNCGLGSEWFARDKFQAAEQSNWKGKENWRAYAERCKNWWLQDGRPMKPKGNQSPAQGKKKMTDAEMIKAAL